MEHGDEKQLDQGLSRRSLLTEGVFLAVIPAVIYLCAYRFDCAYCSLFGVPDELIKPDSGSLLLFASIWVTLLFIGGVTLHSWPSDTERHVGNPKVPAFMVFFFVWWPFILLLSVVASSYKAFYYLEPWWSIPLPVIAFFFVYDLVQLVRRRDPRKAFVAVRVFNKMRESFLSGLHPRSTFLVLILAFWFVFGASQGLGLVRAFNKREFSVLSANTNQVLLRVSGDTAICALVDPQKNRPTGAYVVLKLDGTNQFERRKFSPLSFPKAPWAPIKP